MPFMKKRITAIFMTLFLLFATSALAKPIIKSDSQYLDPSTGLYILQGNVYIEVSDRIITAGLARVDMVSMEVWGSEGITFSQKDIYFTGSSVYVYGSKNKAIIDGGVKFTRSGLDITADSAEFNWKTKIAVLTGNVTVTQNDQISTYDTVTYDVRNNTFL